MKQVHEDELPGCWITPPKNQGQHNEISYGDSYDGRGWMKIYEGCTGGTYYYVCNMSDCGCEGECDCWNPVNEEPNNKTFHFEQVEVLWGICTQCQ